MQQHIFNLRYSENSLGKASNSCQLEFGTKTIAKRRAIILCYANIIQLTYFIANTKRNLLFYDIFQLLKVILRNTAMSYIKIISI